MRLLIFTQVLDMEDQTLGYFHAWVKEFSKHCERITVVCLKKGVFDLPDNVKVLSLGKETADCQQSFAISHQSSINNQRRAHKIQKRLLYTWNFYKHIWRERKNYDVVFVHMNPEYVVLGGLFWRLSGVRIGLWYVHRNVDLKLRIAEKFSHIIFTSSKESFRIQSKKVHQLGHGINVGAFLCDNQKTPLSDGVLRLAHIGRITPIKNLETLVEAVAILHEKEMPCELLLVGNPVTKGDERYLQKLKILVKEKGIGQYVKFSGGVPYSKIKEVYCKAHITVNLTPRGGMDKAVLESIASKTVVITSNDAYRNLFSDFAKFLLFKERDSRDLVSKIEVILSLKKDEIHKIEETLLEKVKANFGVGETVAKIATLLQV